MEKQVKRSFGRLFKMVSALSCAAFLFAGCGGGQDTASTKGSATAEVSGSVSTNGSTSMEKVIGLLSEQFMQDNGQVKITYDATGSGTGIEAVRNKTSDIGLSSRDLKAEEKSKGLKQTTIAKDGIAIIVNDSNTVSDLTSEQIEAVYTGKVSDWSAVGGSSQTISCVGREAGSGTRDGFETITNTKDKCKLAQELTSTGAVIEAVKNNPSAIGYASFSDIEGKPGIKVLTVEKVACSEKTIADGSYKIQRNFNLITREGEALSKAAQAFYDYMVSKDAGALIRKAGVVPAIGQ